MIKNLTKTLALAVIVFSAFACGGGSDGPDKEAPSMDIKVPAVNQTFGKGGDLPLDAVFTDNRSLKSFTASLEFKSLKGAAQLKGISDPWVPAPITISLNGNKTDNKVLANIFAEKIEGACQGGNYTLTFVVEDEAGNKSEATTVDIIIE